MTANVKDAQQRATAAALKEQRARDGALAMQEYLADQRAQQARTARLRAQRLAKEQADAAAPKEAPKKPQTVKKSAKAR
jgi:hypothetical protein